MVRLLIVLSLLSSATAHAADVKQLLQQITSPGSCPKVLTNWRCKEKVFLDKLRELKPDTVVYDEGLGYYAVWGADTVEFTINEYKASPDYTGLSYTRSFATPAEAAAEFERFRQLLEKQYKYVFAPKASESLTYKTRCGGVNVYITCGYEQGSKRMYYLYTTE